MATRQKDWKSEWEKAQRESRKLAKRANHRMVRLEKYSEREGLSEILKFSYGKAQQYIKANLGVGKNGKGRFKEHVKLYDVSDGTNQLSGNALYRANVMIQRARIKAMEEFLASESSTLGESRSGKKTKGIKRIYQNRAKTISSKFLEKYGLSITEEGLKKFFESKKQAKLEKMFGSKVMFIIASYMQKENLRSTKRDLERFFKSHIDLNKHPELTQKDVKRKVGESKKDYLDRLGEFVDFTDDEVLNSFIVQALKEGMDARNLFI